MWSLGRKYVFIDSGENQAIVVTLYRASALQYNIYVPSKFTWIYLQENNCATILVE